ncbi:ArnT family glycosyltransferase [Thermoflexibacter ruber]|uniref:4-amino-4-deoxy-L-arabinose transferase n=1 Tax=Thermoflexibacter ruber TaxID=1003 RepID=A0A1I2A2Z5_9BACT|nr:glycosyltransferase family 39 protein [Thermoflexibacter ruber]SFE38415.1 4-amino-4-deoxy-L-arabinose transferase [Thermoflexibacter ruber]
MKKYKYTFFFGILGGLFFIPFIGNVHLFDWDEINFAEIAREMLVTGNYFRMTIDYLPFNEKPPLFIWFQALSMNLFGINEFAARFPNAVCGIIALIVLFNIGKKLYDQTFGILWAGSCFGSILPHFYFKSGIIDPFFNLFIFLGLYNFFLFYRGWSAKEIQPNAKKKWYDLALASFFIGLAIMTKGPVAFLVISLCIGIYYLYTLWKPLSIAKPLTLSFFFKEYLAFSIGTLAVTLVWYGVEFVLHGEKFIIDFTLRQYAMLSTHDAGHEGFIGYHFVVLLLGCFPASVFALASFRKQEQDQDYQVLFKRFMQILFWVVLILFSFVKTKIVHYSSLCYYPLTYLSALSLYQLWQGKMQYKKWISVVLSIICAIWVLVVVAIPFIGLNPQFIQSFLENDQFAQANFNAEVPWTGWEALIGLYFIIVLIISIFLFKKNEVLKGFYTLFGGTAVMLTLVLIFYIGKVERYTQRAAIDFLKTLQGKDCYVMTIGYKSYAQYFYAQTQPTTKPKFDGDIRWQNYLFYNKIDKDLYVLTKNTAEQELLDLIKPNQVEWERLYEKNGFVFYKRASR